MSYQALAQSERSGESAAGGELVLDCALERPEQHVALVLVSAVPSGFDLLGSWVADQRPALGLARVRADH